MMTVAAEGKEAELATPYIYPTSMVRFSGKYAGLLTAARLPENMKNPNESWEGKLDRMVRIAAVKEAIAAAGVLSSTGADYWRHPPSD